MGEATRSRGRKQPPQASRLAGERRDLVQAILDSPDDDVLRAVYADALEEDGEQEHAEFVRLQLALDDPGAFSCEHPDAERGRWPDSRTPSTRIGKYLGLVNKPDVRPEDLTEWQLKQLREVGWGCPACEAYEAATTREAELLTKENACRWLVDCPSVSGYVPPTEHAKTYHHTTRRGVRWDELVWRRGLPCAAFVQENRWNLFGPMLATCLPMTHVTLRYKRPGLVRCVLPEEAESVSWYGDCSFYGGSPTSNLWQPFWDELRPSDPPMTVDATVHLQPHRHKAYPSARAALEELSAALLRWARRTAREMELRWLTKGEGQAITG